ncbi:MAG TPA: glutamine--fructose-6-phosphate transaminase (isomerizing) [Pirellulaceae bacterium]|nr:glutamine--fructose-6-phosphate transaminase (isomerizing) [Pirellulaceae bacterium]
MCGIVAYIGPRLAQEFILEGLRRLEYRGYDSAGLAVLDAERQFHIYKVAGRIHQLAKKLHGDAMPSGIGIGHTRWATHGKANETNAHPHVGGRDRILTLAHNGVIENYAELKARLIRAGYAFSSETDTEVIAHLIDESLHRMRTQRPGLRGHALGTEAIKDAIGQLRGTYGLVVLFREWPDAVFCARLGSPLVVGIGDNEQFVASDASPLIGYTDRIVYLADHQVAVVTADSLEVSHRDRGVVEHDVRELDLDHRQVELGGFEHFMLKEIFEQPESLLNTLRGRLNDDDATAVFGGLNLEPHKLRRIKRIILTACGTSWHSALVGEYLLEEIAQIPVEVEYASELRYRNAPMDENTLVFAITQSGETADTLAALKEMKRKGYLTLAICNVVGSSIAQESSGGIYLHAGPEIGVASTKAYTSQCLALAMLALHFGRLRHISYSHGREMIDQIRQVPQWVRQALSTNDAVRAIAEKYVHCNNFLYLGRHYNFPTALEGALKLKEISYVHAEGYPAAEMKHGPIALVDSHTPSVFVMPTGFIYDKVMSNLEEIKTRGGPVIAIAAEGDQRIEQVADDVIFIPHAPEFLQPIVAIVPLQLLAYHIAILRGCDVDKPRNLAKSVTVE